MSYKSKNRNIDDLTPQFAQKVKLFFAKCIAVWIQIRMDDWFRSDARQKYLLWQWRTEKQLLWRWLTAAEAKLYARNWKQVTRTLKSDHMTGEAIDVFFENWLPSLYPPTVEMRERVGAIANEFWIEWPYKDKWRWTDKMHFSDNGEPLNLETRLFYERIRQDEYSHLPRQTFQAPDQVMERLEWLSADEKISELVNILAILFTKLDQE